MKINVDNKEAYDMTKILLHWDYPLPMQFLFPLKGRNVAIQVEDIVKIVEKAIAETFK